MNGIVKLIQPLIVQRGQVQTDMQTASPTVPTHDIQPAVWYLKYELARKDGCY